MKINERDREFLRTLTGGNVRWNEVERKDKKWMREVEILENVVLVRRKEIERKI